jgi:hypothetical protein
MSARRVLATIGAAALAVALQTVLPTGPSYAGDAPDLYVASSDDGGSDVNACTQQQPCATIAAALSLANASGTTIHVGAGTFDGQVQPGDGQSVTIDGVSAESTVLALPADSEDFWLVGVMSGTTNLSNLTVAGLMHGVYVGGTGHLTADHVVLTGAGCDLTVEGGSAELVDSTVEDSAGAGCPLSDPSTLAGGDVVVTGGTVSLSRSEVLDPNQSRPGVLVQGGAFSADQSLIDDSLGIAPSNPSLGVQVTGGTATITRSTLHGFGQGVDNVDATALLTDDTFDGNTVGVNADAGTTTVLRSTFQDELASVQGTLAIAGSVLGTDQIENCNAAGGAITDLGYNLATDDSCGFTAATSHDDVTDLHLDNALADHGGPVETVATLQPSSAVDAIPVGAAYGDSATPLCPATGTTDLRGVPRPQGGACDAGSMELAGTTTTLSAPTTAQPHQDLTLQATVDVPDVGVDGLELPVGTVTFSAGDDVLCKNVTVQSGAASCTSSLRTPGRQVLSASFTPAKRSTLHPSDTTAAIDSGIVPMMETPGRTSVRVGRAQTIRMHAAGQPVPLLRLVGGHLPKGLHFHRGYATATISGTAKTSAVGRYHVQVEASNLMGHVIRSLTIVVTHR